jgi:hypothetical protein
MLVGFFLDIPNFWLVKDGLKISAFKLMLGVGKYVCVQLMHISYFRQRKEYMPNIMRKICTIIYFLLQWNSYDDILSNLLFFLDVQNKLFELFV